MRWECRAKNPDASGSEDDVTHNMRQIASVMSINLRLPIARQFTVGSSRERASALGPDDGGVSRR